MACKRFIFAAGLFLLAARGLAQLTPEQMISSKADLAGEAALKEPGGASYEFFEKLLPPLRYVDADFKRYPLVLCSPGSTIKGRIVSDGSVINALARQPSWRNEMGVPVDVLVGRQRQAFGSDLGHLTGPSLWQGYLPIVQLGYEEDAWHYGEEVFASVDEALPGAILARFEFPGPDQGRIELRIESGGDYLSNDHGCIKDASGHLVAAFDEGCWEFNKARSCLLNKESHPEAAVVMIVTPKVEINSTPGTVAPASGAGVPPASAGVSPAKLNAGETPAVAGGTPAPLAQTAAVDEENAGIGGVSAATAVAIKCPRVNDQFYRQQREQAIKRWENLVAGGMQVEVPEAVVNNAWRALIVQQYEILHGNRLNYSAGNQYARMYSNECGDSMRSLLLYGHAETAAQVIPPLFVYRRPGIELHDGAFKLELLADYYFATRDAGLIRQNRNLWQREIDLILKSRQSQTGLLPRERYCSDIETPIISLNNNANCWRGLRDMALVLKDIGDTEAAAKLAAICAEYRQIILAALGKAMVRSVAPPFVPVALSGEEPPPDPITATRLGGYWNLVVPCVLWSGLFPIDSEPANAILHYIQEKGGLCMGLTRMRSPRGVWVNVETIDDLYGLRYALALLKRDEPDRALVSFYGKLAQGFTRDTFYDGESSSIEPLDRFGRQFALPPNSTANASFLLQLRNLLVQDWDLDEDGRADTLRLLFATPRRWLQDGKRIVLQRAPTAFGEVSVLVESELNKGRVTAHVDLPSRSAPTRTLLRLRLPDGFHLQSARAGERALALEGETIDLTGLQGKISVSAAAQR